MSVNFKTLKSFVTAVDARSLSAAAQQLRVAQPALSQHIASLEKHFDQKLLVRSNAGVKPTPAGDQLYRHAQLILSHLDQLENDLASRGHGANTVSGPVSVGLATYSTASALSMPLLKAVRDQYPGINLFINDNFGLVLSEMVVTGRMDMAIIYAGAPMKGVTLEPLLSEELFLIAPAGMNLPGSEEASIPLRALADIDLLLPSRMHLLRRLIDEAFASAGITPNIRAEIESSETLRQAIEARVGATILPAALAGLGSAGAALTVRKIVEPVIRTTISLCIPNHVPMSEQAKVVLGLLRAQIAQLFAAGLDTGIGAPAKESSSN
jgi:LysR family nitrogen assimilation transcriptional regulator